MWDRQFCLSPSPCCNHLCRRPVFAAGNVVHALTRWACDAFGRRTQASGPRGANWATGRIACPTRFARRHRRLSTAPRKRVSGRMEASGRTRFGEGGRDGREDTDCHWVRRGRATRTGDVRAFAGDAASSGEPGKNHPGCGGWTDDSGCGTNGRMWSPHCEEVGATISGEAFSRPG